jgi:Lrp/AsnC family leucine-responsive transcriptional regulator
MVSKRIIDYIDRKILNIIQKNATIQNVDIARKLRMAPSGVLARIRKLERDRIIQRYEVKLDSEALGAGLIAFMHVTADTPPGDLKVAKDLAEIPEVQEVHSVAGEDCYLVKVRVAGTRELAKLMRTRFAELKSIKSTRTTIVLETLKETMEFPIRFPEDDQDE